MAGAWLWAAILRRERVVALVFLALFVGVAGGAVLTAVGVARRTGNAVDRYFDRPSMPVRFVFVCPVGITGAEPDFSPDQCSGTDDVASAAKRLRLSPLVRAATPTRTVLGAARRSPGRTWIPMIDVALMGDRARLGDQVLVEGRAPRTDAANEVLLNVAAAQQLGVGVGDEIEFGGLLADQRLDVAAHGQSDPPAAGSTRMKVVGVGRSIEDIGSKPGPQAFTPPGWWRAHGREDIAGYGAAVSVSLHDPADAHEFDASLPKLLGGRLFQSGDPYESLDATRRVVSLQAGAVWAVAAVMLLAALGFLGIASRRHVTLTLADRSTVVALGFGRRDLLVAAGLVSGPAVAVGAALAAIVAVAASPIGPIGQVRGIEVNPGVTVDWGVVAGGAVAVFAVAAAMLVGSAALVIRRRRVSRLRPSFPGVAALPAPAHAALGLLRPGDQSGVVGAVVGTALAIAVIVFAIGVGGAHASLLAHPARFGQTWDAVAGNFGSAEEVQSGLETVAGMASAGEVGVTRSTTDAAIDGVATYVYSFPKEGPTVGPVIVAGRAPRRGEIALGARTMDKAHVELGDRVKLTQNSPTGRSARLTVVGRAVINDGTGYGTRLDDGAIVADESFPDLEAVVGQFVLVTARPGTSEARLLGDLRGGFGATASGPVLPEDVANLDRIAAAPTVWAIVIGALALLALALALTTLITRRRRDLGVIRVLGFTRSQIVATTMSVGVWIIAPAALVGVPLGLIATRWGWRAIAGWLGVESPSGMPIMPSIGVVVVVTLFAVLVALIPGLRVSGRATSIDLHSE